MKRENKLMFPTKQIISLFVLIMPILLTACGGSSSTDDETQIAIMVAVALTQTATSLEAKAPTEAEPTPVPDEPTEAEPTPIPEESAQVEAGLTPLNPETCANLADSIGQNLGLVGETAEAPFEDSITQQTGTGCQITFATNGLAVDNIGELDPPTSEAMERLGWQQDAQYGGGGIGGYMKGFRKDNALCTVVFAAEPSDPTLCSDDQPITACWENLSPEQRVFKVVLNCAEGEFGEIIPVTE